MTVLHTLAHAKLNLTLDVVGKRPDGYHNLTMVMQEISLGDEITLTLGTKEPWKVISGSQEIPSDDSNLAVKAAKLFFSETGIDPDGLTVEIQKHTPVCAGMGGGSADGAGVLRLLYEHYGQPISREALFRIAENTGSDVPFALFGGTALAREKGQVLSRIPSMPDCDILICKPPFPVSTPALFRAIDSEVIERRPDTKAMLAALEQGSIEEVAKALYNVFEPVVAREHEEIHEIKSVMCCQGALAACMTGSGPTVFGIFTDHQAAEAAYQTLKTKYSDTYLVKPV
ncbi:MAG: 4-(cytidine 5'-diphospho)-2-C-methyl-D-erythritol kinase [Oscillospiraceae bacterium]|nr:4-(cytidine 5'-diphospho)-2-C-methyl-D-erythritol kinase [Oscillospiraceae bacterium]